MFTLDEVIKMFEDTWVCPSVDEANEYCEMMVARDAALHYLKIFQRHEERVRGQLDDLKEEYRPNEPLTWDELRTMEGKPVFVEVDEKYKGWVMVGKFYSLFENEDLDAHVNLYYFGRSMEYSKEMYGYYWQAYRKEVREVDE